MGHYAFLNDENVVVQVIVGKDEDEPYNGQVMDWEAVYAESMGLRCKRTSYNTYANKHANNKVPFRGNYAGIGYQYDEINDVFIPPKPFPSWTLNTQTWIWDAPVPKPEGFYYWDESAQSWIAP